MYPTSPAQSTALSLPLDLFRELVAALTTAHPASACRIERGAALVMAGAVERCPFSSVIFWVDSASAADHRYAVIECDGRWTCECEDFRQRGGPCKHSWAVVIAQACERLDVEATDPTVIPFPDPAYSPDDRFELTAKGLAAVDGAHDGRA